MRRLARLGRSGSGPRWPRFLDRRLQNAFERDGYVVVDLLTPSALDNLRSVFEQVSKSTASAFYVTLDGRGYAENRRISDRIVELLSPGLTRVLTGFDIVGATFLAKPSADEGVLPVHQDWSSVDERHFLALNIWTPLVDTGSLNGALEVLPGSHRWFTNPRSPWYPSIQLPLDGPLRPYLRRLDVAAGRTVVYDNRLFHGSGANRSSADRPVAQLGVVSRGAQTVMATEDESGRVSLRPVDRAAFFAGSGRPPDSTGFLDCRRPTMVAAHALTQDEVLARCTGRSSVQWFRR